MGSILLGWSAPDAGKLNLPEVGQLMAVPLLEEGIVTRNRWSFKKNRDSK